MRDFRIKRGTAEFRGKQVFLLLGILSLGLVSAGCAGLVAGNNTKPADTGGTPPAVSITAPTGGATVSGSVTVSATATDKVGVVSVQFELDGADAGNPVTTSPYNYVWNTTKSSNGSHSLKAIAKDTTGNVGTSSTVTVTVNNKDTTPPTVSITSPANGATVSSTITISASASDSVGVASVQFRVDGSNVGAADTTAPYSYSLNTATLSNGSHSLTAFATDTAGNTATSAAVVVTVNNTTTTPAVSITSPGNGATVSGTITVTANASDSVGIASVQFRVDGSNVGAADTTAPYSYSLNTTTLSNGSHSLTAFATDKSGNTATSAAVVVTVNNGSSTPPTVSITSPANGATVAGTIAVTASASDSVGIASVQFLLDGGALGSKVTASPYSVQWNTTQSSNGSHTLAAQALDLAGNSATSSNVTVTVTQNNNPPPPPVGDQITITDTSGFGQTNQPVSVARPFVQGEIANFAQASIGGTALLTQCDVRNRWPDGSLKFAIVSFVIPSIPVNGSVVVSFSNQTTGNNTGFLTASSMLASGYNFDGQIQLKGTASHNISARAILTAANSGNGCVSPSGGDIDGAIATNGNLCTYWLQGPIVTAVILEDRIGRSYDVNADGATGNPLHPIFEAWFYPSTNQVQLGYTLENDWVSTTASNSSRDQTYSYTLTAGNTNPQNIYSCGNTVSATTTCGVTTPETVLTATRWHHMFCVNGTGVGKQNGCEVGALSVNNNWQYLAETKLFPNWNPNYVFPSGTGIPTPANFYSAWTNTGTNKSDAPLATPHGVGFYPDYLGACGDSNKVTTGDGCTSGSGNDGMDAEGMAYYHGPLTTWDIVTLMSQDSNMLNFVTRGNADAGGAIPYFMREADGPTVNSHYFNSPSGTATTQGRVLSINARTQYDAYSHVNGDCNTNFTAEYINFGGSGFDSGAWQPTNLDTSHWPELAYVAYTMSGEYGFYEEMLLQAANAVSNSGSSSAGCVLATDPGKRQGAIGYAVNYGNEQDRAIAWSHRESALGATVALDGSPEQAYFRDKLSASLAAVEGANSIPCNITGTPNQTNYCGSGTLNGNMSAWTFGNTVRNAYPYIGTPFGFLFSGTWGYPYEGNGQCPASSNCSPAYSGDSNFMNAYTAVTMGWMDDLGFCPHVNGACPMVQWESNYYINATLDPQGPTYAILGDYVVPTLGCSNGTAPGSCSGTPVAITNFEGTGDTLCSSSTTGWPASSNCNQASGSMYAYYGTYSTYPQVIGTNNLDCGDEGYFGESVAGLSYGYGLTSTANSNKMGTYAGAVGFSGTTAFNTLKALLTIGGPNCAASAYSPKWDILPRTATVVGGNPPAGTPTFSPVAGSYSSAQTVTISSSASTVICYNTTGSPKTNGSTGCTTGTLYSGPVAVSSSGTLYAAAGGTGYTDTDSSAVYTITSAAAMPTFGPAAGTYTSSQVVTISDATSGSSISYCFDTTNTCTPSTVGTSYMVSSNGYLRAFATASGYTQSAAASAQYTISSGGGGGGSGLNTTPGWYEIPYSELQGNDNTSSCPPNNFGGYGYDYPAACQAVFVAWSSAVADTLRSRLVIWGGGHVDYSGNELYALDLNMLATGKGPNGQAPSASNPILYRLNNPSPPANSGTPDTLSDGRPNSRHTYEGLNYIPAWTSEALTSTVGPSDILLSIGGCPAPGGCGAGAAWQLNMASVAGECAPNMTNNCGTTMETISQWTYEGGPTEGADTTASWDPKNQVVKWIDSGGNKLYSYSTTTGTSTQLSSSVNIAGYSAIQVQDDYDNLIFFMGCYSSCQAFWVTSVSGAPIVVNNVTLGSSCGGIETAYPPMVWDPIEHVIRIPNQANYQQMYLLSPSTTSSTWNCTTESHGTTSGVDFPPGNNSQLQGLFGKWNYFSNLDIFVLCNDPTQNCWYFVPSRTGANTANASGSTLTNQAESSVLPLRDGNIPGFPNAHIDSVTAAATQGEAKNRQ